MGSLHVEHSHAVQWQHTHLMTLIDCPNFIRLSSHSWNGMGSCPAAASLMHELLKSLRLCGARPKRCAYAVALMMPLLSQSREVSRKSMKAMSVKLLQHTPGQKDEQGSGAALLATHVVMLKSETRRLRVHCRT
jgi:hypothetical protein